MRILSSFQDYYDAGIAYGVDPDLVYERKTREESFVESKTNNREHKLFKERQFYYRNLKNGLMHQHNRLMKPFKIGYVIYSSSRTDQWYLHFCGIRYPFHHIERFKCTPELVGLQSWPNSRAESLNFWKPGDGTDILTSIKDTVWVQIDASKEFEQVPDIINERYQCPIVLEKSYRTGSDFILNPCLKDIGFQNIMDPYAAFQEISMYLAALQNPEDKDLDPAATDLEKIKSHGMDPKYGFRKPPKGK
tara:strand:+ start:677 stop:1420 length:744 start_codon:yes stop_codon:yes gene_type:complete